jgi:hypothetical protein
MPQLDISKIQVFHRDYYDATAGLISEILVEETITNIIDPDFTGIENKANDFFRLKPRRFNFSVRVSDTTFFDEVGTNTEAHENFPNLTNYLLRAFDNLDNQIFEGIISIDISYSEKEQTISILAYDPIVLFVDTISRIATSLLESTYKDPHALQVHLFNSLLSEYFTNSVNKPTYDTDWTIPEWGIGDFRNVYDWKDTVYQFYLDIRDTYVNSAKSYFATKGETLESTHDFSSIQVYRWKNSTDTFLDYPTIGSSGSYFNTIPASEGVLPTNIIPMAHRREIAVEFVGVICFISNTGRKHICIYHKGYIHNWRNVLYSEDSESREMPHNSTSIEELNSDDGNDINYDILPLFFCKYFASNIRIGDMKFAVDWVGKDLSPYSETVTIMFNADWHNPFQYPEIINIGDRAVTDNDIPIDPSRLIDWVFENYRSLTYSESNSDITFDASSIGWLPAIRNASLYLEPRRTLNWMTYNSTKINYLSPSLLSPENVLNIDNSLISDSSIKTKGGNGVCLKGDYVFLETLKFTSFNYNSAYGNKRSLTSLNTQGQINIAGGNYPSGFSNFNTGFNYYVTSGAEYEPAFAFYNFFLYKINYNRDYPLTQVNMDNKPLYKKGNISQIIDKLPSNAVSQDAFASLTPDYDYDTTGSDAKYFKLSELLRFFIASMNLYCYYNQGVYKFTRSFLSSAGIPIVIDIKDIIDWETQTEEYSGVDTESALKPTLNYVPNALDPYYNQYAAMDNKRATCKISRLFCNPDYGIVINSVLSIKSANWRVEKLLKVQAYYDVNLTKFITDPI